MDAPYLRLAAALRQRIHEGEWLPGRRIPSARSLTAEYEIGPGAVHLAIAALKREGLIEGRRGARLTVAYAPAVRTLMDADAAWSYETGDVTGGSCAATASLAARLGVSEGSRVRWERAECLDPDGRPAMLLSSWWHGRRRRHRRVVCEVRTHSMTAEEASALGLAAGTSALLVERTRLDADGRPVQVSDLVLPADRWRVVL